MASCVGEFLPAMATVHVIAEPSHDVRKGNLFLSLFRHAPMRMNGAQMLAK